MNINTKYSELEVCEYMTKELNDDYLKNLVLENNSARIRYGAFDKKRFKYTREKALKVIIDIAKGNKVLREEIIGHWETKAREASKKKKKLKSIEDIDSVMKGKQLAEDMLTLAVELWMEPSQELNEHGDTIFKNCLEGKYIYEEELEATVMSNNKILSMNLADCIDAISNHELIIKEYEEKLKAKDEIIKELRESLKLNEAKEVKKEMTKLGKEVQKNGMELKKINAEAARSVDNLEGYKNETVKSISDFKSDISNIKKEVSKQATAIESNKKLIINELCKMTKEISDTIKSAIGNDNEKLAEGINEAIDRKLDSIAKMNLIMESKVENVQKREEVRINKEVENTKLEDFSEIDDLLNDLL